MKTDAVLRHDKTCMNIENIGPIGCFTQHCLIYLTSPYHGGGNDSLINRGILE